jgi:hypothetical protein
MYNKRQFINAVCILFSLCFISCINKKTQTSELEKAEINNTQEIELHSESNELQDDETDNLEGEYVFSSSKADEELTYIKVSLNERYIHYNEVDFTPAGIQS